MAFYEDANAGRLDDLDLDLDFEDDDDGDEKAAPSWLSSYSDMMTDLMAIFGVLFAFAMMATSQENQDIREEMQTVREQAGLSVEAGEGSYQLEDEFDEVYEQIKNKIAEGGYSESILLEKEDGYINFRFKDNLLFYPDSAVMRESSFDILRYMGDLLLGVDSGIDSIEISGFTAKVGDESPGNFFSWELSSDRAISVLKFFSTECSLPQSKMFVSGYSHYRPVAENDTEEDRSLNRRVEVKIVRSKAR